MKKLYFLLLYCVLFFSICGCSQSGRRNLQNEEKKERVSQELSRSSGDANVVIREIEPQTGAAKNLAVLYKELRPAVILIYSSTESTTFQGSGFIIDPSGIGVSNYHVFEGTIKGEESLKLYDGRTFKISEVISINREDDFIVFRIDNPLGEYFPFLKISSRLPQIGEGCFTIGNPKGLESTLSQGIISQVRNNGKLIQTTAEITNGSSGGPLFNMNGEVIGITSSGIGEANLNFAVSIDLIKRK